ncbi:MFS transporter [Haloarcula sp. H-GB4]|uniref:MFS transporter n=1 Tax=Haloarcula sp. H-GB4 TaxID=3069755 RepID=UPI0027B24A8D|nr:MFS transporter [Haloarcula sp. H-GB4]MDQ2074510.1 MFS transporter [Haloarcula sp. H-GB4]
MVSLASLFGRDASVLYNRSFQLLLLTNLTPPLGVALISPLLNTLTGPFAVSGAKIGLLVTAFSAPSIVSIPLVGSLADRYGRKPVLVTGLLVFGVAGAAVGLTTDFHTALVFRFVQGIGFAGLTPVIVTSTGDLFQDSAEATAQGIRFATSGVTMMVFPLVAGALVAIAWQLPFFLYGISIPIALVLLLFLDEPHTRAASKDTTEQPNFRDLIAYLDTQITALLIARAVPNAFYTAFLTYNSLVIVRVLDGSPGQAGLLVATASLAHTVAATQSGRMTAYFSTRFQPLLGATLGMSVGLLFVGVAPSYPVVVLGSALVGFGFGTTLSLYRSVITSISETLRAGLVSIGSALGRVGSTFTPVLIGGGISRLSPLVGTTGAIKTAIVLLSIVGGTIALVCLLVSDLHGHSHCHVGKYS